jgi:hypothetical protein
MLACLTIEIPHVPFELKNEALCLVADPHVRPLLFLCNVEPIRDGVRAFFPRGIFRRNQDGLESIIQSKLFFVLQFNLHPT